MRKILLIIVTILLIVLAYIVIWKGFSIANFKISTIKDLESETTKLNTKIEGTKKLVDVEFKENKDNLLNASKELISSRDNYENKFSLITPEELKRANQKEKYEIEFLWTKIGNHATDKGIILKLDVTSGSSGTENLKDLNFTVTGTYVGITNFIYDLEDDENLSFRIENFKMIPKNDSLEATFVVKDISVNIQTTNATNEEITEAEETSEGETKSENEETSSKNEISNDKSNTLTDQKKTVK